MDILDLGHPLPTAVAASVARRGGGGGNKVRKLEWTAGTAMAQGADVIFTIGAARSNHARLTAASGARLGLDVALRATGYRDAGEELP